MNEVDRAARAAKNLCLLSVKLHTECKSTLGLGKNEKYKFVKLHTVCKTTPSVKAHLVCGRIENTQSLSPCVKLDTECKSWVLFV